MSTLSTRSIFISHALPDKPFVRRLRSALEGAGFPTWVDEHELLPGDDLPGSIAQALADASAFVVVISEQSLGSRWLTYELRLATQRMIEGQLLVIPVRVDEARPPPEIRSLLWADFRSDFSSGWRVLHASLERSLSKDDSSKSVDQDLVGQALSLADSNSTRLRVILAEHVPEVLRTLRTLEARTGFTNNHAHANLVDALAHLSILAERNELTSEEQVQQIGHLEDHCRRAMTESVEAIVLARVTDLDRMWQNYVERATGLHASGSLRLALTHPALEELHSRISMTIESARKRQLETEWDDARSAAAAWHEAAVLCQELTERVSELIASAEMLDGDHPISTS